jgi:zinc resistance-associated protein
MKKTIMAAVLVTGIVAAGAASANWGQRGGWGNNGYANCPCGQAGVAVQQVDPAIQEKMDQFFTDTQDLRKQMAVKQAEKAALLRSDNPDPAAVAALTGELFDLRAEMREKAETAGVEQYFGPRGGRGMMGAGGNGFYGKGRHHGGRGMGQGNGMGGGRF